MMDIHQTIRLWATLSPRLLRTEPVRYSAKEVSPVNQEDTGEITTPETAQSPVSLTD